MTKLKKRQSLVSAVLILFILLVFMFIRQKETVKTAPIDPVVNEHLKQARGLQQQGKLKESFVIFEKYALRGHPDAMYQAANAYRRGWGVEPNLEKARHFFRLAVEYNYSYRGRNAYELGKLFQRSQGKDCNRIAVSWFKKAMEWDYPKASMKLSKHYELGVGVKQDIGKAITYYEIASRLGFESTQLKYAEILVKGKYGITPDPDRAYQLVARAVASLERKALGGSGSAAKQLGRLYRKGVLVEASQTTSYDWFLRSAKLGNTGGMHDLAQMMLDNSKFITQQPEALLWLEKAATGGYGGAMTALGRLHLKEKYGLKKSKAIFWFERGVKVPHGGSIEELAKLYAGGILVPKNLKEAIRLAHIGREIGHSGSKKLLKKLLEKSKKKNSQKI